MPSSADYKVPQPQQTMEMVTPQDAIVSQQPTTEPQPEMTTEGTLRGGFVEECNCCCCGEECVCC
ncbi:hypothetical protein QBC45DRAFT_412958 [Copromyces sp. CBS 386.78]|nr:hypothetical protein QBC45DRAFT_412958 [Copromyces sp. CBS 386.78]